MLVGLLCALLAALGYGVGSVLQARAAQTTETATGLDPRLLVRLAGSVPFVIGVGLDLLAFLASLVALRTLPLFLVQSAVAASVGVTAVVVALLGTRLARRDIAWLAALGVGLVLLAAAAQPERAVPLASGGRWALLIACPLLAATGAIAARRSSRASAAVLATLAGLSFAIVAIAARTLQVPNPWWHVLLDPSLWAIAAGGVLGMLFFSTALQRGSVTTATAVMFATDTIVPALIGLALLGDTARPGRGPVAVAGFVITLAAAVGLAAYGEAPAPDPQPARQTSDNPSP